MEAFFLKEQQVKPPETDKSSAKESDILFNDGNFDTFSDWKEHQEFRLRKVNSDSERNLREKNAKLTFRFSCFWAGFIMLIILLKGFSSWIDFSLTQTEFLFVTGSLTTSMFAFYLLVLKYLFNTDNGVTRKPKKKQKSKPVKKQNSKKKKSTPQK
jgi:hypothetical protein